MKDQKRQDIKIFLLGAEPEDIDRELAALRETWPSVEFSVAHNRQEFMEKLSLFCPDLVVADVAMPDITVVEAIDIIREKGWEVPVVALASEDKENEALASIRQGAMSCLLKKNIAGLAAQAKRCLEMGERRKAEERAETERMRLQMLLFGNRMMEAIGRLSGGVTHDFNNILTGIMGYAEICLSDSPLEPETRRRLESILAISQRGADLVKELLTFSRQMATDFTVVDLNGFITDIMHFLKRIVGKTIEIRLELFPEVLPIGCEPIQFTQALMILVLNARDALSGSGTIIIETKRGLTGDAHVPDGWSAEDWDKYCCITISDNGTGINEQHLPRIFDPFFAVRESGSRTRYGLPVVSSAIRTHNGTIAVSSTTSEGTSFTICLPLCDAQKQSGEMQFYEKIPATARERLSGAETVLVVEDEDELRDMLASFMGSLGYTVVPARNGHEALSLYRKAPEKYHIVISDMLMPHKGGIELFHEIRKLNQHARFILVTGYSLADVDEAVLAQLTAILRKPYTPQQVVSLMRNILDA